MYKILVPLFAVAVFASQMAEASIKISLDSVPIPGQVSFADGPIDPSPGNSGFLGTIYNDGSNTPLESWNTFCVESGNFAETIGLGNTKYNIHSTHEDTALSTGNYVTDEAKWVYYAFSRGLLTGWTANDGEEVQEAIWNLVDGGGMGGPALGGANGKAATWVAQANAAVAGGWTGERIRVLNPVNINNGVHRQSMLYEIPEPATILVWSALGCLGIVALRRHAKRA